MTAKVKITNENEWKINNDSGDYAWSMEGTETGTVQVSIQIDLGARPGPYIYDWHCSMKWQGTPTVLKTCNFAYAGAPDATAAQIDGGVGASDADLGTGGVAQIDNCHPIGSVVVEAADTTAMVGSGTFTYNGRYISLLGHNDGGTTLSATASDFVFYLIRRTEQAQDT